MFQNEKKRNRGSTSMFETEEDLKLARARKLASWKVQQGLDDAIKSASNIGDDVDPLDAFMMQIGITAQQEKDAALSKERDLLALQSQSEGSDHLNSVECAPRATDIKVADQSPALFAPQVPAPALDDVTKNLWVEVPELSKMTDSQVADLRKHQLDNMKVKGASASLPIPKPIVNWAQSGLPTSFIELMKAHNYAKPTPVQSQAISALLSGHDIKAIAKTGSGKTLAFLIPMFRHVVHRRKNSGFTGPFGLVLAPTRELAIQIYDQVQLFGVKALHLRVACLVGGSDAQQASSQLNRGADIIIATPGRLIEVLGMRKGRALELKHVSFVVLDEADRIFDGGFEPQVARILAAAHPGRQIGMFSATFPPIVQKVANRFLSANSIEIRFGGRFVIPNTIKQVVEVVSETTKLFRLVDILRQHQKEAVLVFVSDQDSAELLSVALKSTFEIQNVTLLHAGLDMEDRVDALSTFQDAARAKVKSSRVLVATSLASRGLHLPEISLVINYDCPSHTEDYVHKVGRTGRAGASGTAITFITKDDDAHVSNLGKLLKKCGVTDLPVELATMAEEFERKCQAGEANRPSRGFGKGSGDEKKTQLAQMQQIAQRARFGEEYDLDIVPATETPDKGAVELQESDPIPLPAAESAAKALLRKFSMKTGLVVAPKSPECQLTTGKFPINDMAQYVRRGLIDCIRGRGVEGDDFGDSVLSLKGVFQPPSLNSRKPASEDKKEEPLHILIEAETPRDLMIAEQALRRRTAELAASPRAMVEMNVSKRF